MFIFVVKVVMDIKSCATGGGGGSSCAGWKTKSVGVTGGNLSQVVGLRSCSRGLVCRKS